MQRILLLFFLSITFSTYSVEVNDIPGVYEFAYQPWFTGSLFSYDGENTPKNVVALQPYLFVNVNYGEYKDNYSFQSTPNEVVVIPLSIFYYGLTNFWDMQLDLQTVSRFEQSESSTNFGDITLLFGFQLIRETKSRPFLRLLVQETFPTGKYDNLSQSKNQTDSSGQGAFITSIGFATEKTHPWFYNHPIRTRWNFLVNIPSKVSVKGLNSYGGALDTDGTIKDGVSFFFLFSPEISITQNWVITADITYTKQLKGSFSGNKGFNPDGTEAFINFLQGDSLDLAPAIEYNLNNQFGIIGGVWFSVLGRNTAAFVSGVISAFVSF